MNRPNTIRCRTAAAAGCVDFVLSPEKICEELVRIAKHPLVASNAGRAAPVLQAEVEREVDERGGKGAPLASGGHGTPLTGARQARAEADAKAKRPSAHDELFKKILVLVRNHAGADFSLYKSSTIQRRITRRMVLNKQKTLDAYADFLKCNPKELDTLYSDMLIAVTSFFRNPDGFEFLKHTVFPKLLSRRGDQPVRVWILGCSTGQEAYSMAMTFMESSEHTARAAACRFSPPTSMTRCWTKPAAVFTPRAWSQDVSPERLRRFFAEEEAGYRVSKELRQMVVFARQNLLSDPPFSHMDLISCRNLLIYLEPSCRRRSSRCSTTRSTPKGICFWAPASRSPGLRRCSRRSSGSKKSFCENRAGRRSFACPAGPYIHPCTRPHTRWPRKSCPHPGAHPGA